MTAEIHRARIDHPIAWLGYDPVPGREERIAQNDYDDVSEELANLFKAAQAKPVATTCPA